MPEVRSDETRVCGRCNLAQPLADFPMHRSAKGTPYYHTRCRACRRDQNRARAKTPGGKAVKRLGTLRREFGLTEVQYQQMHDQQNGRCAICNRPETKRHWKGTLMRLCVDHDHKTGRIRALLCSGCNAGLGGFKDNPAALLVAFDYVRTFSGAVDSGERESQADREVAA